MDIESANIPTAIGGRGEGARGGRVSLYRRCVCVCVCVFGKTRVSCTTSGNHLLDA